MSADPDAAAARGPGTALRPRLFAIGAVAGVGAAAAGVWAGARGGGPLAWAVVAIAGALAGWVSALAGARLGSALSAVRRMIASGGPAPRSAFAEVNALVRALRARTREEETRRDAEARERADLTALLGAATEGILRVSADGRIVRANPAAAELLGLSQGSAGSGVASTIRSAPIRKAIRTALDRRAASAVEQELDGRRVFILAQPAEPEGAVVSLVDLTEIRRLETARRDFVANASHELKTPLTSIRGYAETLLDESIPEDMRRRFLQTIRENAERLQRVVDDLLDLSRIEAGAWEPDPGPVRIADSALEAWSGVEARAAERGVVLDLGEGASLSVQADAFALVQIFGNLLDNAVRHSAPGGRVRLGAALVRPDAGAAPGQIELHVADDGSGIPTESLPRIFERFFRVDAARTGEVGGTGLGLAIVKHLVEQMGGRVRAESELGRGTTITFTLPAPAGSEPSPDPAGRPHNRVGPPTERPRYIRVTER